MSEPKVTIYTSQSCPYCVWSKKLLDKKQASYQEIRIDQDETAMKELQQRTKRTSVPQIFVGNRHIGGYDDMVALDQDGELDKLLRSEAL